MSDFLNKQSQTAPGSIPPEHVRTVPADEQRRKLGALSALFARASRNSEKVIVPINDSAFANDGLHPAFYCVHSLSGAGGTDFYHLAKLLPNVRFYGIQAPPKKMADASFGCSVEAMADYYAGALIEYQPNGPFLLGGWSAGAIIGLEIAQNLRARGRDVALFVAIDAVPENTAAGYRPWHPLYLLELIGNVPGWLAAEKLARTERLRPLAQRVCKKLVALVTAGFAGKADDLSAKGYVVEGFMDLSRYPEDQKLFMKRLYTALLEYTPQTYLGNVVAYEAQVRPLFWLPQVGRIWCKIAPHARVVRVRGTHLSILRENDVGALAQDLQTRIAQMELKAGSVEPPSPALNRAA